jgi:IS30 family transposase
MGTEYGQLTEGERCEIFRLYASGISQAEIGRMIGRDKGTISRELRRNALPRGDYLPVSAERIALSRRHQRRKSKIERSSWLLEVVRDQLIAMGRSPEQIAGRLELEQGKPVISHESIYRFAHSKEGRQENLHRYLPRAKAKRGRRAKRRGKPLIPNRVSIHDRPDVVAARQEFGHWEGDLMAFSRPGQNNVVLAERKSRYILAARMPDKTAATTTASMENLLSLLPEQAKRSITFDNGGEFASHASLGLLTFFCDPRSPWQKGTVENSIGRLRRDLPRSTTPTDYTEADFHDIIASHNETPRKCLGFKTPAEVLLSEINQSRCT